MNRYIFLALITCCFFFPTNGFSQEKNFEELEKNLLQVLELQDSIRQDLNKKQKELRSPEAAGRTEKLEGEVQALSNRLEEIKTSFSEIALGVDLSSLKKIQRNEVFSWSEELRELLGPLIGELKEFTKRPREISQLKEEIALYKQQKKTAEAAEANLKSLMEQLTNAKLKSPVEKLLNSWEEKLTHLNAELAIVEEKLNNKMADRQTIGETLRSFASLFFESRGRNFFLAILVAVIVFVSLRHVPRIVLGTLGDRGKRLSAAGKIVQVIGLVTSTLGAMLAFLGMLYLFEDWVLLLIFSLLFLGLLWTMKDTLPELWQQLALLLNLGPVREGERVEIFGIPFRVQSLGFYCYFKNDEFSDGKVLRLPIQDVLNLLRLLP